MTAPLPAAWRTDEDLTSARQHVAARNPGWTWPASCGVARVDDGELAPAEAATHWEHPNLWSWRELPDGTGPAGRFVAFFVADLNDRPADDRDVAFRARLRG